MRISRLSRLSILPRSAFAGFGFPREVIVVATRWYLRYALSSRGVEELVERGVKVDHVTIYPVAGGLRHCWPTLPAMSASRWGSLMGGRDLREGC
jgi:transposase-like protein